MSKRINLYLLLFFVIFGVLVFIWLTYIPENQRDFLTASDKGRELIMDLASPRYGGVLRVALPDRLTFEHPIIIDTTFQHSIVHQMYNGLCYIDINGEMKGELLRFWEIDNFASSLIVKIREKVRFHDGVELTAKDVANSYNMYSKDTVFRKNYPFIDNIMKTEAITTYSVQFLLTKSDEEILKKICQLPVFIFYRPEKAGSSEYPQGTGPFALQEQKRDKEWVLEANSEYFGGRPYLDRIVYISTTDEKAVMELFYSRKIDLAKLSRSQSFNQSYVHLDSKTDVFTGSMYDVWLSHK